MPEFTLQFSAQWFGVDDPVLLSPKNVSLFVSVWFSLISAESFGWLCSSNYRKVNKFRCFLDLLAPCITNYILPIVDNRRLISLPTVP